MAMALMYMQIFLVERIEKTEELEEIEEIAVKLSIQKSKRL